MLDNSTLSTSFLERILQNSDEGIIYATAIRNDHQEIIDFQFKLVNIAAQKILNKKEEDILEHRMRKVFSESIYSLFVDYKNVVETGVRLKKEMPYVQEKLNTWIRVNVSKHEDGVLINLSDVSDYREIIAENARSRNLYSILVHQLPGVEVALVNRNLTLDILRGKPFKIFQGNTRLKEGRNLKKALNNEQMEVLSPLFKYAFSGKKQRKEIVFEESLYRISFVPFRENLSYISHVLVILEDISIFKITQNDLRNKIYALESANESLEQFAYVASHDLQEPLRKIRAFGDRLSSKYAEVLEGSGQDYIERMQNAAARMQTLINDLLKYSRVGRINEPAQPVELDDIIRNILNDMESAIQDTQAVINVSSLPVIQGEPSQFRQLFQNLISNAIKFRVAGKRPEVNITAEEVDASSLEEIEGLAQSPVYYKLKVQDNGIGFDEKYLDRIFNIFQRLHGRSEYKGTGIGLAICRKIIENHGGYISAESIPGEGATFIIILPAIAKREPSLESN